jgi:hypothetical protein
MSTRQFEFPYGLKESPISLKQLRNAFSQNLIVLLGDKDTDENHKHLRKTQEAMAQGKHRFERGKNFFQSGKHEAARLNVPLNWKVKTVQGVGHSNSKMAKAAAKLLINTTPQTHNSAGISSQSNSYLLKTTWGQRDRYAKYSPENKRLGCWSVALAQILYFHRLTPEGTVSYLCTKKRYSIKESFGENKFSWGLFVDKFDDKNSTDSQNEVAKYIYCTSVAIQKDFGTDSYVLKKHAQRAAAIARYYGCETKLHDNNKYSLTQIKQIIKQEIDLRRPLMLHLRSLSTDLSDKDYHAVAVDGYRIRKDEFWIHINMGHKGSDNDWYDFSLPILKYNDNNYRKIITIKPNSLSSFRNNNGNSSKSKPRVAYTEKLNAPDLMQTDPVAQLPGGGKNYCAPVSISNSLMWLAENGFDNLTPKLNNRKKSQLELARILGAKDYMNSEDGTGMYGIFRGVSKYLKECDYEYSYLKCQTWRKHPKEFSSGVEVPNLDWIKEGLHGSSAVWLNCGWYKYHIKTKEYERIGGHWVTLVGYGVDENGKKNPNILIVHDPASRAGKEPAHEDVVVRRIKNGLLTGDKAGLPQNAKGYYKLGGGMHIKKSADVAILDGAVVLKLK